MLKIDEEPVIDKQIISSSFAHFLPMYRRLGRVSCVT